jgi:hypothetical protein
MDIPAAGYILTDDILEADYALSCSITDAEEEGGRLLTCSLLDAKNEREITSTALLYSTIEETYNMLPYMVWSLLSSAPLKQREPEKEIVEIEKTPVYFDARGGGGGGGGAARFPADAGPPDAWKRRWVFLNARAGLSSRYYLGSGDSTPTASILTFDGGVESELHLFKFLALQLGVNFALDQAEYRRSPSNPTPMVYATSVLSVPLMVKAVFNPSPLTTLGPYLGAHWTTPLLGPARPPPFGLLGGLDLSVKAGPGVLFFDLRYSLDLGATDVVDSPISYRRMFITLSAGYKLGFAGR